MRVKARALIPNIKSVLELPIFLNMYPPIKLPTERPEKNYMSMQFMIIEAIAKFITSCNNNHQVPQKSGVGDINQLLYFTYCTITECVKSSIKRIPTCIQPCLKKILFKAIEILYGERYVNIYFGMLKLKLLNLNSTQILTLNFDKGSHFKYTCLGYRYWLKCPIFKLSFQKISIIDLRFPDFFFFAECRY